MKVYVVAAGEYSEYHVVAVFSSKDKADKCIANNKGSGNYDPPWDVLEMEVDEILNATELGLGLFNVNIQESKSTGEITTDVRRESDLPDPNRTYLYIDANDKWGRANVFNWQGWARDKKHAVKIAADVRRQKIAESQLIASSSNSNSTENQP